MTDSLTERTAPPPPESPNRLLMLARFGARIAHENLFDATVNIDGDPTEGHENHGGPSWGFDTCPHGDCVLVRAETADPPPRSANVEQDEKDEVLGVVRPSVPAQGVEMTGIELIAKERERQQRVEGWTPEHDDAHDLCEMTEAAVLPVGGIPRGYGATVDGRTAPAVAVESIVVEAE